MKNTPKGTSLSPLWMYAPRNFLIEYYHAKLIEYLLECDNHAKNLYFKIDTLEDQFDIPDAILYPYGW